jgi:hypothetical protein
MKKLVALLTPAIYLSLASSAFAAAGDTPITTCDTSGQFAILCGLTAKSFGSVIGSLVQLLFVVAVIVALLYLIYGGFRWLVSSGDKTQVASAREHIVAAVIGLVIIFLSYFILNLILGFFLGSGVSLSNLQIPTLHLTP